jgi:hypothetical protein
MPVQRQRTFSQQSAPAPSMARTNSRGTASQRSGNVPFTKNGPTPPPYQTESRRETAMQAFLSQEEPFNTLTHQTPQLQRSMSQSQRRPDLEQVLEQPLADLPDPSDFIFKLGSSTPTLSVSPSTPIFSNTLSIYQLPGASFNGPPTPTSDSLTTATTLMSRQNSVMTINEPLLESMQMMKCNSSTSYSQNFNQDQTFYDQVPSHFPSSSRRSSNEEQNQLLAGAGGASHESQFPPSFPFTPSGLSGEKMEKSQSNESTSSFSSNASSRSKQRLQAQINLAAARPLMPKGGEDTLMSRDNSSQSMNRLDSKDGSSDKVAIPSKNTYQRPKHDRVYCKQCDSHQEGFRGEHELRRHVDREHKTLVKKWVCEEPKDGHQHPKPVLALSRCKACHQQKKKYGAYYNAAAHLRRAHFKPKKPQRTKSNAKVDDGEKRGGKGGGDWPPMSELKYWMKEVEEQVTDCALTEEELAQEDAANASDDENIDNTFEDALYSQPTSSSGTTFDHSFADPSPIHLYPTAINTNIYGMTNMPLDLSGSGSQGLCMDTQSMYTPSSQDSFPSFSPHPLFTNDATMAFFDSSLSVSSLSQNQNYSLDDQVLLAGHDFVDPYFQ